MKVRKAAVEFPVTKIRHPKNIIDQDIEEQSKKPNELPQPEPLPEYDAKFKTVHEYIVKCNPDEEWPVIQKWMDRKPNSLQDAMSMLAEHPSIKTRARRLALLAQRELRKFELDYKDRTGILRDLAREYWEEKKQAGYHKQITNDMIEDWIIEHYGTTYIEMDTRVKDMKNVAELLSKLADNVDIRDADFRRMIDKINVKDSTDPGWFGNQHRVRDRKAGK
jgi:hypothetical protein